MPAPVQPTKCWKGRMAEPPTNGHVLSPHEAHPAAGEAVVSLAAGEEAFVLHTSAAEHRAGREFAHGLDAYRLPASPHVGGLHSMPDDRSACVLRCNAARHSAHSAAHLHRPRSVAVVHDSEFLLEQLGVGGAATQAGLGRR